MFAGEASFVLDSCRASPVQIHLSCLRAALVPIILPLPAFVPIAPMGAGLLQPFRGNPSPTPGWVRFPFAIVSPVWTHHHEAFLGEDGRGEKLFLAPSQKRRPVGPWWGCTYWSLFPFAAWLVHAWWRGPHTKIPKSLPGSRESNTGLGVSVPLAMIIV